MECVYSLGGGVYPTGKPDAYTAWPPQKWVAESPIPTLD